MDSSQRYQQAVEFLFGRINYERSPAVGYRKNNFRLGRMRGLLERLGNPHLRMPAVHIAGTKGKGSTAAMVAAVLQAAGYRTGLFCSPHLYRVEERLTVDGQPASPEAVADLVDQIRPAVRVMDARAQPGSTGPTYFEITTAMALLYFHQQRVDVAVLEVGMGGRLDSTNVCRPRVSVITSISRDHTRQLGTSLAQIAAEKAGIIKPGVPVVSGATADEARQRIASIAAARGAPLVQLGERFHYDYAPPPPLGVEHCSSGSADGKGPHYLMRIASAALPDGPLADHARRVSVKGSDILDGRGLPSTDGDTALRESFDPAGVDPEHGVGRVHVRTWRQSWRDVPMPLLGAHQGANCAVALAAVDTLRDQGWEIPNEAVYSGMRNVRVPARVEVVARRPMVVVDAAHNWASVRALVETIRTCFQARRRLLIFATTQEKDHRGMLWQLLPHFDVVIFTRYQNNPRGVPPGDLAVLAAHLSEKRAFVSQTPQGAWQIAQHLAAPEDLICVTGSFFIAAEIRELITGPAFDTPPPTPADHAVSLAAGLAPVTRASHKKI